MPDLPEPPAAPPAPLPLQGRIALVTGAARGIGLAIAGRLAQAGARVALLDAPAQLSLPAYPPAAPAALAEAVAALSRQGHTVQALHADVRSCQQLHQAFSRVESSWGAVQVLVNNAAVGVLKPIEDTEPELWRLHMETIAEAAFHGCRRALPAMRAQGWGRIINIASYAGLRGLPQGAAYTAAKHALVGLTRALALEAGGDGICVNAVCPGSVESPMARRMCADLQLSAEEGLALFSSRHTLQTPLQADDVAQAVAWLASEAAARIKGVCFSVDDGWSAG